MFDMCSHVAVMQTRTYPNALTLRGPLNPLNKVFIYELQKRKKFIFLLIFACILEFALIYSKLEAFTQNLNSVFSNCNLNILRGSFFHTYCILNVRRCWNHITSVESSSERSKLV